MDAGIYAGGAYPSVIHNDQDWAIDCRAARACADASWQDDSGDFPGGCGASGPVRAQVPLPPALATDCVANNNAAAVLLPDNRTLLQMQPFYRPAPGAPFVAWYHTGAPNPFPWTLDILGDGALGAHGGSGLSALGGSLRLGELLNTTGAITHALKLELWAHKYYWWDWANASTCHTWPAMGCDSYFADRSIGYNGTNPALKPGALLAVPPARAPAVAAALATVPARKILAALVDYGAYVVDDTGSEAGGGAFCAEPPVNGEVEAAYGFSIAIDRPLSPSQGAPFYWDLVRIYQALAVVTNNGPGAVGGGGVPRAPLAPPICGAASD